MDLGLILFVITMWRKWREEGNGVVDVSVKLCVYSFLCILFLGPSSRPYVLWVNIVFCKSTIWWCFLLCFCIVWAHLILQDRFLLLHNVFVKYLYKCHKCSSFNACSAQLRFECGLSFLWEWVFMLAIEWADVMPL